MDFALTTLLVTTAVGAAMLVGVLWLVMRSRRDVPPGMALVLDRMGQPRTVRFESSVVPPFAATATLCDLTTKTLVVSRGAQGFRCHDDVRLSITAHVQIAVNRTTEDILKVVAQVGADRAADLATLHAMFGPRIEEAIASVVREHDFEEVLERRLEVKERAIMTLGTDLDGWVVRDLSLVDVEPVPRATYDPEDMLDAKALCTIAERVARATLQRTEIETAMRRDVARHEVERAEAELASRS